MHGDAEASDTVGVAGPGRGSVGASYRPLASDCPTVLVGDGGLAQLVCVDIPTKTPSAYLIDPSTGLTLASMRLTKSGLLGGIYSYLDRRDRLVVADGSNSVLVIAHRRTVAGTWQLSVARRYPLTRVVPSSDSVVGLTPAWDGRIWFASARGVIGTVNPKTGRVRSAHLPRGEQVANSIASAPGGIAVASTHALYLYRSAPSGAIQRVWRRAYNRGTTRKPGQLSWGTGATPTFFGPRTGSEYLTITDNADRMEHLLVYAARTGALVCRTPVVRGTENSPIGLGRSVYVASTYGYPYPAYPAGAGSSHPASAPIAGGMVRVDVRRSGHGCVVAWRNRVHSSSVPRLSRTDGLIYTTTRTGNESDADRYDFVAISARTGKVIAPHVARIRRAVRPDPTSRRDRPAPPIHSGRTDRLPEHRTVVKAPRPSAHRDPTGEQDQRDGDATERPHRRAPRSRAAGRGRRTPRVGVLLGQRLVIGAEPRAGRQRRAEQ